MEPRETPDSAIEEGSRTREGGVHPKSRDSCGHEVYRHFTSHAEPRQASTAMEFLMGKLDSAGSDQDSGRTKMPL